MRLLHAIIQAMINGSHYSTLHVGIATLDALTQCSGRVIEDWLNLPTDRPAVRSRSQHSLVSRGLAARDGDILLRASVYGDIPIYPITQHERCSSNALAAWFRRCLISRELAHVIVPDSVSRLGKPAQWVYRTIAHDRECRLGLRLGAIMCGGARQRARVIADLLYAEAVELCGPFTYRIIDST